MTRQETISELSRYFDIRELVCPDCFGKFGFVSWQFFDRDFLNMLLVLRQAVICRAMYVNNWHKGGDLTQRGFRCNLCQLCKDKTDRGILYCSAHANGAAIDFDVKDMDVNAVHELVRSKAYLLPCNVRMETGVTWNHIDIYDNGQAFSEFNA